MKFINTTLMDLNQKENWVRNNYRPFGWSEGEIELKRREIDLNHKYLGVFSNGNHQGSGELLFSLDEFQENYLLFSRLNILADDVFEGGPTQQIIYDFLEEGLSNLCLSKEILDFYTRIYFKLKEIGIFESTTLLPSIRKYHPRLKNSIRKDTCLDLHFFSIRNYGK